MPSRTEREPQVAALPMRRDDRGRLRVMLVTSRETGRWVVPKGWPMDGLKPWRAAAIEALEEAGAEGAVERGPLGTYDYDKRLSDGSLLPCRVTLYPLHVEELRDRWKERAERKRRWFDPAEAATLVDEPQLSTILEGLAGKRGKAKRAKGKEAA